MMEQQHLKQFYAEKELRSCGFTPESINAIQATTVITRDGMQHVVPSSQQHLNQEQARNVQQQTRILPEETSSTIHSLQQQVIDQQKMFSRFKQFSDQRIMHLEHNLGKAIEQLKEVSEVVMTLKSNAGAAAKAAAVANRTDGKPSTEAIDRNKVAPSEVQVEDIFYSGNRR